MINFHSFETYLYSSHLLGGSIDKSLVPQTAQALDRLKSDFSIEKGIDKLRTEWNRKVPVPGFNIEGNYGPSLAYMMGVLVGLGDDFLEKGYVHSERISLEFLPDQEVRHRQNSKSSIHLIGDEAQSSMRIMDEVTSTLFKKAHNKLADLENKKTSCERALEGDG